MRETFALLTQDRALLKDESFRHAGERREDYE
jgi:hypothetical protein